MAIDDIIYEESDSFILEIVGVNGTNIDVLFDNNAISEIVGDNGSSTDILFDPIVTTEIPEILITDFGFI